MRRLQALRYFKGSGFPIPSDAPFRSISFIRELIFLSVFLSSICHCKYSSQAISDQSLFIVSLDQLMRSTLSFFKLFKTSVKLGKIFSVLSRFQHRIVLFQAHNNDILFVFSRYNNSFIIIGRLIAIAFKVIAKCGIVYF